MMLHGTFYPNMGREIDSYLESQFADNRHVHWSSKTMDIN